MEPGCSNGSSKRILRSNSATKKVECSNQPKHSSKGASFIKFLDLDFSKQLQIPHEFVTIFNGYVPHRFIIECAMTKKCWRVEVEEDEDGAIYFREGWAEFVGAHSLKVGNFLLFEYEEQSIFLVKIYDRNGCQKMVLDAQGGKNNPLKIIDIEEREDSEAFESQPKILRTSHQRQEQTKRLFTDGNGIYNKKHTIPRKRVKTATASLTENNATFSVKIHKYMNYQFHQLSIPKAISLARLAHKKGVTLENALGNRWPVKLSHIKDGRAVLSRGWKEFMNDNEVAAGDSLSFEFVSNDLLKVLVTKASQVERKSEEAKSQNGATIAPTNMDCDLDELDACTAHVIPPEASITTKMSRKRGSSELSSSSFSFLWGPATAGAYLHVPKLVTEGQNLTNKDNVVLRDPDGKCWPMEVSTRLDGRVALTKGWVEFWKGHVIKAGDSLDFEFVSEYLIEVKINRGKPLKSPLKTEEEIINLSTNDDDEPPTEPETVMIGIEPDANLPTAFDVCVSVHE